MLGLLRHTIEGLRRACRRLGGEVVEDTCFVRTGKYHHEVIDDLVRVIEEEKPTGKIRLDVASGELSVDIENGVVKDLYAWYSDLASTSQVETDYMDLKGYVEQYFVGRELSSREWDSVLDEASIIYSGREEEDLIREAWTETSEWVNYSILNELNLDMTLNVTNYGGVYPSIYGKNLSLKPRDLRKLKKVFEDMYDVREGGEGNGLASDIWFAVKHGVERAWLSAIIKALEIKGLIKKE